MSGIFLVMLASALTGGLAVYIFFAMKPAPYNEPTTVYAAGIRLEQVAGAAGARPRILIAFGAFLACLVFLAGYVSGL